MFSLPCFLIIKMVRLNYRSYHFLFIYIVPIHFKMKKIIIIFFKIFSNKKSIKKSIK